MKLISATMKALVPAKLQDQGCSCGLRGWSMFVLKGARVFNAFGTLSCSTHAWASDTLYCWERPPPSRNVESKGPGVPRNIQVSFSRRTLGCSKCCDWSVIGKTSCSWSDFTYSNRADLNRRSDQLPLLCRHTTFHLHTRIYTQECRHTWPVTITGRWTW